jgi:hypothetical protein
MYSLSSSQEIGNPEIYAVYRGRFDYHTDKKETFLNARYFLRFINLFCMNGGLELAQRKGTNPKDSSSPEDMGFFMSIIDTISPYLLSRVIDKYAEGLIEFITNYLLKSPIEVVKAFSTDIIKSAYNAVQTLAKRTYYYEKASEIYEYFFLKIAIICIKTDFLERKLNGVSFLGDINKSIKSREFVKITKKELTTIIEEENIIEQIIKGHPQMIAKANELFKLMFDENKMSEKNLLLIWNTMRKGDLETKNSLLSIMNNIYYELSYKNMEFFIKQIGEVEPRHLAPDEVELAFKIVNFSKYKADCPDDKSSVSLSVSTG